MNLISKKIKTRIKLLFICIYLCNFYVFSQEGEYIKIENFIFNTEQLKKNQKGIIIPQLDRNLNDRIEFFIQETFPNIIDDSKNIIWQSYKTTTNTILKAHSMSFMVRVSIKNTNENKIYRYIEIDYFPKTDELSTYYIWDSEKRNFRINDSELERRSYLPQLTDLKIENQPNKAGINDILQEYRALIGGINDNFVYFNQAKESDLDKINQNISSYVKQNYSNVDFVMNIVFDSYHTFISAYDIYHYYTFIVQVKLQGSSTPNFIEVFYNPSTEIVNSDFVWSSQRETFYRPSQND